ncbi:hypothetical protein [Methylovulum psychrotolerans]|uniref:Uncharacterized protein n=1 Tax=Methylovulum psychrotolerans TaxID=1704499 RepID=A0A2S5CHY1_9GAMM|nr:hypothetical protein [Methylovulum psychrotolerans]POZ50411.1 hypothetical protein AADEFJLK_03824 [Methylovulum psychrotolerans]
MMRSGYCVCPHCGRATTVTGRFGTALQCRCGAWLPPALLDRVRHYWLVQIALAFGGAALLFAVAVFFPDLPRGPWQRLFSPLVQGPAISAFLLSYLVLVCHKRRCGHDRGIYRAFLGAVLLMASGFLAALVRAFIRV